MKVKEKTTQKAIIKSEIENNGWKIIKLNTSEWAENEVWKVESVWSPIGKKAFAIFENDPMSFDENILDAWAVTVSPTRQKKNEESSIIQMSLSNK